MSVPPWVPTFRVRWRPPDCSRVAAIVTTFGPHHQSQTLRNFLTKNRKLRKHINFHSSTD